MRVRRVTDARPWTDDQEAKRTGSVAAGFEPRLHHCWSSTATGQLADALAEYRTWPSDAFLAGVCRDLETELAYRGHQDG